MLSSNTIAIHSNSNHSEQQLGQGGAGRVMPYQLARYGVQIARKFLLLVICTWKRSDFCVCAQIAVSGRCQSILSNVFVIAQRVTICGSSISNWLRPILTTVAVDCSHRKTGWKEFFPGAYSIDRAISDTLSGLVLLHESMNIAHNENKPANLLKVIKRFYSDTFHASFATLGKSDLLGLGK